MGGRRDFDVGAGDYACLERSLQSCDVGDLRFEPGDRVADQGQVVVGFDVQLFGEADDLIVMVDGFDGLLEADGDDEADDDGGDVDEEVFPGVRRFRGVGGRRA